MANKYYSMKSDGKFEDPEDRQAVKMQTVPSVPISAGSSPNLILPKGEAPISKQDLRDMDTPEMREWKRKKEEEEKKKKKMR